MISKREFIKFVNNLWKSNLIKILDMQIPPELRDTKLIFEILNTTEDLSLALYQLGYLLENNLEVLKVEDNDMKLYFTPGELKKLGPHFLHLPLGETTFILINIIPIRQSYIDESGKKNIHERFAIICLPYKNVKSLQTTKRKFPFFSRVIEFRLVKAFSVLNHIIVVPKIVVEQIIELEPKAGSIYRIQKEEYNMTKKYSVKKLPDKEHILEI